jgi:hypothetical protein
LKYPGGELVMQASSPITLHTGTTTLYCSCINLRVQDDSITLTRDVDQVYQSEIKN